MTAVAPRDLALLALKIELPGASMADIGARLGVSARTVVRRLERPEVRAEYEIQARASLKRAALAAGAAAERLVAVMVKLADDEKALPASRLAACTAVLAQARELFDLHELGERVAAFEAAQRGQRFS